MLPSDELTPNVVNKPTSPKGALHSLILSDSSNDGGMNRSRSPSWSDQVLGFGRVIASKVGVEKLLSDSSSSGKSMPLAEENSSNTPSSSSGSGGFFSRLFDGGSSSTSQKVTTQNRVSSAGSLLSEVEANSKKVKATSNGEKNENSKSPPPPIIYVVEKGDTLLKVALKFNTSVGRLRRLNRNNSFLIPGARLKVPTCTSVKLNSTSSAPIINMKANCKGVEDSTSVDTKEVSTPVKQSSSNSFSNISEKKNIASEKLVREAVKFCAIGKSVQGCLLIASDFVMFNPDVSDPAVIERGLMEYQFCIDMTEINDCCVLSHISGRDNHTRKATDDNGNGFTEEEKNENKNESGSENDDNEDEGRDSDTETTVATASTFATTTPQAAPNPASSTSSIPTTEKTFLQLFWTARDGISKSLFFEVEEPRVQRLLDLLKLKILRTQKRLALTSPANLAAHVSLTGGCSEGASPLELFEGGSTAAGSSSGGRAKGWGSKEWRKKAYLAFRGGKLSFGNTIEDGESHQVSSPLERRKRVEQRRRLLTPHIPTVLGDVSELLTSEYIEALEKAIPITCRGDDWRLLYSLSKHGVSVDTFHARVYNCGPTITVVKNDLGDLFGCFASCDWQRGGNWHGTGDCMVFSILRNGKFDFQSWKWTGKNDDFMVMEGGAGIAMGSGGGSFALYLGEDFLNGSSGRCTTFDNESLTSSADYRVMLMETYGFDMYCRETWERQRRKDILKF
eukprot:g6268.t1